MGWMLASSCVFRKAKAGAPPSKVVMPAPKVVTDQQPEIAAPPETMEAAIPPHTPRALEVPPALPPAPKPARQKRGRSRVAASPSPGAVGPRAPAPSGTRSIQLAPLMTDAEQQAYAAAIGDSLGKTQRNIAAAEGRMLTPAQREIMAQARSLAEQAVETRPRDLQAAKSLAERAEILSRDLVAQLR